MRGREFVLTVPEGDAPYFARLAAAIVAEIRRGRLKPGDALPGSRTLAALLGVHRNTVLAAVRELELEGWLEGTPARATRVCASLPEPPRARRLPGVGLAALAGALALAAGAAFKTALIVRGAYNQGFAIPRMPVRGTRA